MSRDVLALTSSAYAVSCAMMAVPVLVFHDVVDIVLVIGSKTEGAELTFLSNVETLVQVGEKSL